MRKPIEKLKALPRRQKRRFFTVGVVVTVTGFLLLTTAPNTDNESVRIEMEPTATTTISVGDTITLHTAVDSQRPINAVEGVVSYPTSMFTLVSTSSEKSFIQLWTQQPQKNTDGNIVFAGGTHQDKGFNGRGTIFSTTFEATAPGTADISIVDGAAFAHNGRGTRLSLDSQSITVSVGGETISESDGQADTSGGGTNNDSISTSDVDLAKADENGISLGGFIRALISPMHYEAYDLNGDGSNNLIDLSIYFTR